MLERIITDKMKKIIFISLVLVFSISNLFSFYPNFMEKQEDVSDVDNKYYGIKLTDGTNRYYGFINQSGVLKIISYSNESEYNNWWSNKTKDEFEYTNCNPCL